MSWRVTHFLQGCTCDIWLLKCLMGYYVYTKFHNDQFRHSSNRKVITSAVWKTVLVLLLRRIMKYAQEMAITWCPYQVSYIHIHMGGNWNIPCWFFVQLIFNPEDTGDIFLWNGGSYMDYTTLYLRKWQLSILRLLSEQFQMSHCWYCWWEGFVKNTN